MSEVSPELVQITREFLQDWGNSSKLREALEKARARNQLPQEVGPHITISRQAGTRGSEIPRLVAQKLRWNVLDKGPIDYLAQGKHFLEKHLQATLDEKSIWLKESLADWFTTLVTRGEKSLVEVERILWLAGIHGRIVLLGRAARFALPEKNGLSVRLIASPEYRIHELGQYKDMPRREARQLMEAIDKDRGAFVQRHYGQHLDDPNLFDLVINTERFQFDAIARQIVHAYKAINGANLALE